MSLKMHPLNILVVDDEMIVRYTLAGFLKALGHHCTCVEDGRTGLEELGSHPYHMAFVDIRMPGMDGIELLQQAQKTHPSIPIVIMTGHGSDETRSTAIRCGAFSFLSKPFSLNDIKVLINKIESFCSGPSNATR